MYCFGDGQKIKAMHSVMVLAFIRKELIHIQTDVLDNEISFIIFKIVN